jgi:hypothetical protein
MRIPFFRIFYSTTFTVLSLILAALLLITPIDQTRQAIGNRQIYNTFIIAGTHLLTLVIAVFIYAGRLFNNRSVLASIPRPWSPLENSDVKKRVRHFIAEGLKKSAVIAYEVYPRDLSDNKGPDEHNLRSSSTQAARDSRHATKAEPVWGIISHPGWSAPSSPDLPNLHYDPVIHELAHLIEAKAVSLAPAEQLSSPALGEPPTPDPLAVELLQRPATMGLRDYIWHLASLDMINPSSLGDDFLAIYEKARFSNRPLDEAEFRDLMRIFAAILRGMTTLSPDTIAELHAEEERMTSDLSPSTSIADRESLRSSATVEYTPRVKHCRNPNGSPTPSPRSRTASRDTKRTTASRAGLERQSVRSASSPGWNGLRTPSLTSLRPARSNASSARSQDSSGSVIRLAEARGPLDLPYTIFDSSGQPI